jgi:virginiamycin B lyase
MQSRKSGKKVSLWPLLASVLMVVASLSQATVAAADGNSDAVIRGTVRSSDGAALYGIFVRARGVGKTSTTYVYTDENGNYNFPPLPLGTYQVSVGISWKQSVQLIASGATQDFSIQLGPGLVNQVTGTSLLKVIPGTEEEKTRLGQDCDPCHQTTRLFAHAPTTPDGWDTIVKNMLTVRLPEEDWYSPSLHIDHPMYEHYKAEYSPEHMQALTEYLENTITAETMNEYAAKALVRPTGEAARVVFTEWDLPPETRSANAVLTDPDGILWFIAGGNTVGRLDPHTGETDLWKAPGVASNSRFHDLDIDKDRNLWITASMIDKIVKFDVHTHRFTSWDTSTTGVGWTYPTGPSTGTRTTYPHTGGFDKAGNYWVTTMGGADSGVVKLDPRTGKFTKFSLPTKWAFTYGLEVDQKDNVWFAEHQANKIGKIDPAGKLTEYPVPTPFDLPRRIRVDSKGRPWFTESGVPAHIAMLDPVTGKITEYEYGIPTGYPYWIRIDKFDKIWFNSAEGNVIGRLDPETKKFVLFPYPLTETRSINGSIDNRNDPVAILYSVPGRPAVARMYVRP